MTDEGVDLRMKGMIRNRLGRHWGFATEAQREQKGFRGGGRGRCGGRVFGVLDSGGELSKNC
jgi:hypothetical protein